MKNLNQAKVCRLIWQKKGITRVAISRELKLDKSTITNITNQLIKKDLVREVAVGSSTPQGGRRPIMLTINKDYGVSLGFEIQPDYWRACVVNLDGEIINDNVVACQISQDNLDEVLLNGIDFMQTRLKGMNTRLLGVGIGLSGVIDSNSAIVIQSLPLQIEKPLGLGEKLEKQMNLPVFLDNDANCCAWGEIIFHKNPYLINFICVLLELRAEELQFKKTGGLAVGLGIVIDSKVYTGSHNAAGEFISILAKPESVSQFSLTAEEILALNSNEGIFTKFAQELSEHIAYLANVLDVTDIFLSIHNVRFQEKLLTILKNKVKEKYPYRLTHKCHIRLSSVADKAVAYGAASLVLENFFSNAAEGF